MRENFRDKPRRLKLEQMHIKGPLHVYTLHGPMFLFIERLGFLLSPLGLFQIDSFFFSVQRLHGFRQVVQHVSKHVAYEIN